MTEKNLFVSIKKILHLTVVFQMKQNILQCIYSKTPPPNCGQVVRTYVSGDSHGSGTTRGFVSLDSFLELYKKYKKTVCDNDWF